MPQCEWVWFWLLHTRSLSPNQSSKPAHLPSINSPTCTIKLRLLHHSPLFLVWFAVHSVLLVLIIVPDTFLHLIFSSSDHPSVSFRQPSFFPQYLITISCLPQQLGCASDPLAKCHSAVKPQLQSNFIDRLRAKL